MSHLLVVELPGGNDGDILAAALAMGHRFTLMTGQPAHYRAQPALAPLLAQASAVIDVGWMEPPALLARLRRAHAADPFGAVLCLQDLRITEAALVAEALGLAHLSPAAAALCRNKPAVRARLAAAGIAQPAFAEVEGAEELLAAVRRIGLPVIVKPADGFGSQNIFALRRRQDLATLEALAELVAAGPGAYGLGVAASGRLLVERLVEGPVIGCDTMTANGVHRLLGVNEKLYFPPPSFAIEGGCLTANVGQFAAIEAYVFALLDAVGFNHGAAHIELALGADGPQLIEINPRLVGARIGRLLSAVRGGSVHEALIGLHLDGRLPAPAAAPHHAVTRWLAAPAAGILDEITLPGPLGEARARLVEVAVLAQPGASVLPPLDNADRLACIMTAGPDRAAAERLAERIRAHTRITMRAAAQAPLTDTAQAPLADTAQAPLTDTAQAPLAGAAQAPLARAADSRKAAAKTAQN